MLIPVLLLFVINWVIAICFAADEPLYRIWIFFLFTFESLSRKYLSVVTSSEHISPAVEREVLGARSCWGFCRRNCPPPLRELHTFRGRVMGGGPGWGTPEDAFALSFQPDLIHGCLLQLPSCISWHTYLVFFCHAHSGDRSSGLALLSCAV